MNDHAPEAVPAQLTEAKGTSLARELITSNFWMSGLAMLKYILRSFRVKQVDGIFSSTRRYVSLCATDAWFQASQARLEQHGN